MISQLFSNKFKVKNQYKKQKRTKKAQKRTNVIILSRIQFNSIIKKTDNLNK